MPAVPEVPMTTTGTQRCSSTDIAFAVVHGWSMYCSSISVPIEVPNQMLARYIRISANRKFGVASPIKPRNVSPWSPQLD